MAAAAIEPPLVSVSSAVPGVVLDLRYATKRNFLGQAVYPHANALLRAPTAKKLGKAAELLKEKGYRLVVYDAYRPLSVQKKMWALKPDPRYVANPARGSQHNRGAAVDVSLADLDGRALAMPSDFDEFSERAWRTYEGGDADARKRRDELRAAMEAAGFKGITEEWWHYADPDGKGWPLLDAPL